MIVINYISKKKIKKSLDITQRAEPRKKRDNNKTGSGEPVLLLYDTINISPKIKTNKPTQIILTRKIKLSIHIWNDIRDTLIQGPFIKIYKYKTPP